MIFLPHDVVRINGKKGLYEVVSINRNTPRTIWVTDDDCDSELEVRNTESVLVVRHYNRKDIEQ